MSLTLPPALTRSIFKDGQPRARGYRDSNALLLGAASFFLPCGFTQAVQVYALSTGSPVRAGLVMGMFALGTTPGLMGAGALSSLARGQRATRVFRFVGVAVIAFAAVNLSGGMSLLTGSAVGPAKAATAAQRSGNVSDDGGYQVAHVTVSSTGYSPAETVVYAGEPVKWELAADGFGCPSTINATSLGIDNPIEATTDTTVDLQALQPGTYAYQCTMGMYHGKFVVIDKSQSDPMTSDPMTGNPTTEETPSLHCVAGCLRPEG
jgi:plastocyanin